MTLDLVVLGLLIIVNVLNHSPYIAARWYVPTGVVGSVLIIWVGYRAGVSLSDIGLAPDSIVRGLLWSAGCIGLVTGVYVIGGSMTFTRRFLADDRAVLGPRTLLYKVLVNVPLGTVLFEELRVSGCGTGAADPVGAGLAGRGCCPVCCSASGTSCRSLIMHDADAAVGDACSARGSGVESSW